MADSWKKLCLRFISFFPPPFDTTGFLDWTATGEGYHLDAVDGGQHGVEGSSHYCIFVLFLAFLSFFSLFVIV